MIIYLHIKTNETEKKKLIKQKTKKKNTSSILKKNKMFIYYFFYFFLNNIIITGLNINYIHKNPPIIIRIHIIINNKLHTIKQETKNSHII